MPRTPETATRKVQVWLGRLARTYLQQIGKFRPNGCRRPIITHRQIEGDKLRAVMKIVRLEDQRFASQSL